MIIYTRLWETMAKKEITTYQLINDYRFSKGQLDRLKKNGNVQMNIIDTLCKILECEIGDIAEYKEDRSL